MNLEEIGSRIKHLRKSLKLSRDDLARAAGVTEHAVGNWERGQTNLKGSSLIAVAALLKTSPTHILTGKEPKATHGAVNETAGNHHVRELPAALGQSIPLLTKEKIRNNFDTKEIAYDKPAWPNYIQTDVRGDRLFAIDLTDAEVLDSAHPISAKSKARLTVQQGTIFNRDGSRQTLLVLHRPSGQILVKKALQNGAEWYLYSLNPQLPPVRWDENYQAIGEIRKIEITL